MNRKLLSAILAVLLLACMGADQAATPPAPATVRGIANVRDHGANGNGRGDDTKAFQEAIASFERPMNKHKWSESGGTVLVPGGHFIVLETLDIRYGGLRIKGVGSRSYRNRACWIEFRGDGPLFRFPADGLSPEGFEMRDIVLVRGGDPLAVAFQLWTGPSGHSNFRWGFTWDNVGIFHFARALEVKREEGDSQWQVGDIQIDRCNWSLNRQAIVFETVCNINMMTISDSFMRQNRPPRGQPAKPALDIRGQRVTLERNNFEGQPWACLFRLGDTYTVEGNYFESNSSLAIRAVGCKRVTVRNEYTWPATGAFNGKFSYEDVDDLTIDEPKPNVTLIRCRNVTWPAMGSWRGLVSTEAKR